MHFTTLLAIALVPAGALAAPAPKPWAKSAAGEWIANNTVYPRVGSLNNVHEACTLKDTNFILADGNACKYWVNGNGVIFRGVCRHTGNSVQCR